MIYGCIGERLKHSFSKEIHEKISDYSYEIREIERESLKDFILSKDFKGINVTIPYKEKVIPWLDFIDDSAKEIGAVNTVVNKDGKLYGYNTDFAGLKELILKSEIVIKGKTVLVLGSGGTAKTAQSVLNYFEAGKIITVSRKSSENTITYEEAEVLYKDSADVIVNTTPVGMFPDCDSSPINLDKYKNISGVIDVIYNPLETKLVADAKKRGIKGANGLYMLVSQAVYASGYFKGIESDTKVTDKVFNEILREKKNIVLTGMPGCGKTTVGKLLAKITGKDFIDSDEVITEKYGHPSEIINSEGEKCFRAIESKVIKELSSLNGKIIATGGGVVLKEENIESLKRNSVIFFIDRSIEDIKPTKDRPLSQSKELLEKLYRERIGIYKSSCHYAINGNCSPDETAKKIKEHFYEN